MSDEKKGFDTSQGFDLRVWLSLWSYEKTHSLGIGLGIAFLSAASASEYLLAAYLAILFWALGIRGSPYRETKSGDKKPKKHTQREVRKRTSDGRGHGMHAQLLAEIRHKPHYFGMGGLVGDRAGYFAHYYWFGEFPTHYQQLPEIVQWLFLF